MRGARWRDGILRRSRHRCPPCATESGAGGSGDTPSGVSAGEAGAVVGDVTGGGRTSRSPRVDCAASGAELKDDTPDPPSGRRAASTPGRTYEIPPFSVGVSADFS